MADNEASRPKRAVGDVSYTFISQSSTGQVDSSTFANPSGTAGRHGAFVAIGVVLVLASLGAALAGSRGVVTVLGVVGIVLGGAFVAVGARGELRERAAMRALAARIDGEQRGPVG